MPADEKQPMWGQTFTIPLHPHMQWVRDRAKAQERPMSWVMRKLIEAEMEREAKAA